MAIDRSPDAGLWQSTLHDRADDAILEAEDAKNALLASGWEAGPTEIREVWVEDVFAGYMAEFNFTTPGGLLPGEEAPPSVWPWVLGGAALIVGATLIVIAVGGRRRR